MKNEIETMKNLFQRRRSITDYICVAYGYKFDCFLILLRRDY